MEGNAVEGDSAKTAPPPGMSSVLRAARRVLRPLAKILLAQAVPIQQAVGLLKQAYVDAATEELDRAGSRSSDSLLSLSTGIHRKEIKRLREIPVRENPIPNTVSLGSQLVARWTGEARYLDSDGEPLSLPRNIDALGTPSFDELVMSLTTDIHPRTVLEELRRIGVVRIADDKQIHLVTGAFVPQKGFEEKVFYFERNLHDHLDVAARNLAAEEPPLLERSVHYSDLSREAVDELSRLASREGMKLLKKVNRRARTLRSRNESPTERGAGEPVRMNFGLYFYRDPSNDRPGGNDERGGGTDAE